MSTRPRALTAATALLLGGALAGCGTELAPDVHPGQAAVVDGERIGFDDVDDLAEGLCQADEASLKEAKQASPMATYRAYAMRDLVTEVLSTRFAADRDLEPALLPSGFTGQFNLPPGLNLRGFEDTLTQSLEGESRLSPDAREAIRRDLMVRATDAATFYAAGIDELGSGADEESALTAGSKAFEEWQEDVELDIDPRFGDIDSASGEFVAPEGALSVAVSDAARAAIQGQPDTDAALALPDGQRCG